MVQKREKTPFRAVRSLAIRYNPSARCQYSGCPFHADLAPDAVALSKRHVAETGHRVQITDTTVSYCMGEPW